MQTQVPKILRKVATPPWEPLTEIEIRTHLRLPPTAVHDVELAKLIAAAREQTESDVSYIAATQQLVLSLAAWPEGNVIRLPVFNATAVDSITYELEGTQTLDPAEYTLLDSHVYPLIQRAGDAWPSLDQGTWDAIKVTYTAGWALAADVPDWFKQTIAAYVGFLWYRGEDHDRSQAYLEVYRENALRVMATYVG